MSSKDPKGKETATDNMKDKMNEMKDNLNDMKEKVKGNF